MLNSVTKYPYVVRPLFVIGMQMQYETNKNTHAKNRMLLPCIFLNNIVYT